MATKKKKLPAKVVERKFNKAEERKAKFIKENEAFLAKTLDIHIQIGDKEEIQTYTVKELVHRISFLQKGIEAQQRFTLSMAKQFHAAVPSHPFFAGCDEKFMKNLADSPDPYVSKMLPAGAVDSKDMDRLDQMMPPSSEIGMPVVEKENDVPL